MFPVFCIADEAARDEALRKRATSALGAEELLALAKVVHDWDETMRQFRKPAANDNRARVAPR